MCGGTPIFASCNTLVIGLSPRVRGNRGLRLNCSGAARSIPACAGEPSLPTSRSMTIKVYPRVCGGTGGEVAILSLVFGLSPRVRGNLDCFQFQQFRHGSIPACAGEPYIDEYRHEDTRVYPRVCGGTDSLPKLMNKYDGLSPRVRGNPYIRLSIGNR